MNDEFENALTWFQAAPSRWLQSARQDLSACAEWIWGVIQGDFNEDPSTAQTVTSTVISMIPFVDQICDVRDVVANCRKINSEPKETWHWVALVLTLIGLFPSLGSLLKGCGKVMFSSIRKASHASGVARISDDAFNAAVRNLNGFLQRPEVRKTLKVLKIDNPYRYLARKLRELTGQLTTPKLLAAFDSAKEGADSLLKLVQKWGNQALSTRAGQLMQTIDNVRRQADQQLGKAIAPARDILLRLENRLNVEADLMHRAHLKTVNPHAWKNVSLDDEVALTEKTKPSWLDDTNDLKYKQASRVPERAGWPGINKDASGPLKNAIATFHKAQPVVLPPGTTIYRIIAPNSRDNSICWMSEAEFRALKSKADWRRRFAVLVSWNSNGEYVTYTVPPGKGLHVWSGPAASQKLPGTSFVFEGGSEQIVLNPSDLRMEYLGRRKSTGWGYANFGETVNLTGVPVLTNNW